MTIVTLTTDFGLQDYYCALIKGTLLSVCPELQLVDVSHQVQNFDIVQAAFILRNAWHNFPTKTIHLVSVNDLANAQQSFLALEKNGHYFIAPDNGIFSLLFDELNEPIYKLPKPEKSSFPLKDIFAATVTKLTAGESLDQFAEITTERVERMSFQPVTTTKQIRGSIVYIDQYENVVSNVNRNLFERISKGRPFELYFKRFDPITKLSEHYYDVPVGEILCLFNSADHLEISINMGKAASLLGLKKEDGIQIEFK
jgi:hypothetical protein